MKTTEQLIAEFLSNGGKIKKATKTATPKDLQRLKRNGWMFGGKRTYVATLSKRQERAEMFEGIIAKPTVKGYAF